MNQSRKGSVSFTGGSQYTYDIQDTELAYQHNLLSWSNANCISVTLAIILLNSNYMHTILKVIVFIANVMYIIYT